MNQVERQTESNHQNENLNKTPVVEVVRIFNAPIERVWKAWSDPDLLTQWWGPVGYTSSSAKINFRVGGKYLVAMQDPAGKVVWSTGTYEQIVPYEKVVCTDQFADELGNVISPEEAGAPGDWDGMDTALLTVHFEYTDDDETKIHLRHDGIPARIHD